MGKTYHFLVHVKFLFTTKESPVPHNTFTATRNIKTLSIFPSCLYIFEPV